MSMEEEAARQAAANATTNQPTAAAAPSPSAPAATSQETQPAPATDDEEEAMLQQALAMSEARDGGDVEMAEGAEGDEELTEEEMIARAIEMSMQGEEEGAKK